MRRFGTLAATLGTVLTANCTEPAPESASSPRREPLTVRVCVVNHARLPVSYTVIDPSIAFANEKLKAHANITLTVTEKTSYEADANQLVLGEGEAVNPRSFCTLPHDIALLFTGATNVWSVREGSNTGNILYGSELENRKSAIIYGHLHKHAQTTLHELGHLFGLQHAAEPSDIMHPHHEETQSYRSLERLRHRHRDDILPGDRNHVSPTIPAGNS